MKELLSIVFLFALHGLGSDLQAQVYVTQDGQVAFSSEAPLELIQAASDELFGAIDTEKHSFAFSLRIISLNGFNSALQREHFNEKFLESELFPKASFQGKLIERIDFSEPGTYQVRAKGQFEVHGVSQERIIRATLIVKPKEVLLESHFTVLVADHAIQIPQVVFQNIAEEIEVTVQATLKPAKS